MTRAHWRRIGRQSPSRLTHAHTRLRSSVGRREMSTDGDDDHTSSESIRRGGPGGSVSRLLSARRSSDYPVGCTAGRTDDVAVVYRMPTCGGRRQRPSRETAGGPADEMTSPPSSAASLTHVSSFHWWQRKRICRRDATRRPAGAAELVSPPRTKQSRLSLARHSLDSCRQFFAAKTVTRLHFNRSGPVCRCDFASSYINRSCYAGTAYAMGLCLSATSRYSTKTARRRIAKTAPRNSTGTLVFWRQRSPRHSTGVNHYVAPSAGGVGLIGDFRQITGYISKTAQDRRAVSRNRKPYPLYRMVTLPMTSSDP